MPEISSDRALMRSSGRLIDLVTCRGVPPVGAPFVSIYVCHRNGVQETKGSPWRDGPSEFGTHQGRQVLEDNEVNCVFCRIINGFLAGPIVFEDDQTLAFLDHRPLFPGHCLIVPKRHFETLSDLPSNLVGPFFKRVQLLARAVESALEA